MWNDVETCMIWLTHPHVCPKKQSARSLHRSLGSQEPNPPTFCFPKSKSFGKIIKARTLWCSGKGIQAMPGTQKTALGNVWFAEVCRMYICIHTHVERWHGGPHRGLRVGINWRVLSLRSSFVARPGSHEGVFQDVLGSKNASWILMNVLDPERDFLIRFRCNLISRFGTHETDASF